MGYIFLGHGSLRANPAYTDPEMEWVAVPQGTTIQFYADTGQGLMYGSRRLDVWSQLTQHLDPVDSTHVTYNLHLSSAKDLWDEELKNYPDFGGHTLIRAGVDGVPDPIKMCTGTRAKCPTDPRQIAAGATHTCDGILARYPGELFWLACTSVTRATPEVQGVVDAARGDAPKNVYMGQDPDKAQDPQAPLPKKNLSRDKIDMTVVDKVNERTIKDLSQAETKDVYQLGDLVMVDLGNQRAEHPYLSWLKEQDGVVKGQLTLTKKGTAFAAGTMTLSGGGDKQAIAVALARSSKNKIE